MSGSVRIVTSGQTLTVNITRPDGSAPGGFADGNLATPVSFPQAITSDTSYYFNTPTALTVSTVLHGAEIASSAGSSVLVFLEDGQQRVLAPTSSYPTTADSSYATSAAPSYAGARANGYDRRLKVYNFKASHLRSTRSALAACRASGTEARLCFDGDSTVGGVGSGGIGTLDWPAQFASRLVASGLPSQTSGFVAANKASALDARVTVGSGWVSLNGSSVLYLNSSTTNALSFASTNTGTVAKVFYANSGGPITVSIDGGAGVLVTPAGGSTMGTYSVTGLANATHTISVTRSSGSGQVFGFEVCSSTPGLRILNQGIGGLKSANLSGSNWFEAPKLGATGFNAHCTFLMTAVNDAIAAIPVATYKAQMQTGITDLKSGGSDLVILTSVPAQQSGVALDQSAYLSALYDLADANDCPLIDLTDLLGTYAIQNGFTAMSDTVHPNATGYGVIASAVYNALLLN